MAVGTPLMSKVDFQFLSFPEALTSSSHCPALNVIIGVIGIFDLQWYAVRSVENEV